MKGVSIDFLTILAVAIVIALAFFATRPLTDEKTIKIGFIGPLSGYVEKTGFEVKASIGSAVKEINDRGGISGKKLELVAEDGKCSYSDAQEAARRLFAKQVPIIIGGVCETETRGAGSVIGALNGVQPEGKKVLLFAPCSSNSPDSTEKALRLYQFDSQSYGAASADFAYNKLAAKTAAILRCEQAWCSETAVEFKKKFTVFGGSVIFERIAASAGKNENEFVKEVEPAITGLRDSKADLVYVVGDAPYSAITSILIGKFNVSADVKIMATGSFADTQLLQNEKLFHSLPANNVLTVVLPVVSTPDCSLEARDAMMLLASSLRAAGIEDSNLIKKEFLKGAAGKPLAYTSKTIGELRGTPAS